MKALSLERPYFRLIELLIGRLFRDLKTNSIFRINKRQRKIMVLGWSHCSLQHGDRMVMNSLQQDSVDNASCYFWELQKEQQSNHELMKSKQRELVLETWPLTWRLPPWWPVSLFSGWSLHRSPNELLQACSWGSSEGLGDAPAASSALAPRFSRVLFFRIGLSSRYLFNPKCPTLPGLRRVNLAMTGAETCQEQRTVRCKRWCKEINEEMERIKSRR